MKTKRERMRVSINKNVDMDVESFVRYVLHRCLTDDELRELDKIIKEENNKDFSSYDD